MIAADLLRPTWTDELRSAAVDPLIEEDALLEAQVLDVRLDAARMTLGILFELRIAIDLNEAPAGVLVASGVEDFRWTAEKRESRTTAWNVLGSIVDRGVDDLCLSLSCYPDAELTFRASSLRYFNCNVPGMRLGPPDYHDDDELVRASVPSWDSEVEVVSGSALEATRPYGSAHTN